jgi:hypothetical protein
MFASVVVAIAVENVMMPSEPHAGNLYVSSVKMLLDVVTDLAPTRSTYRDSRVVTGIKFREMALLVTHQGINIARCNLPDTY